MTLGSPGTWIVPNSPCSAALASKLVIALQSGQCDRTFPDRNSGGMPHNSIRVLKINGEHLIG